MAPIAVQTQTVEDVSSKLGSLKLRGLAGKTAPDVDPGKSTLSGPLKYQGLLDQYQWLDSTPSIGREFSNELQIGDILRAPNADELIRDLGVLGESRAVVQGCGWSSRSVSRRGVCFLRAQTCSNDEMLEFIARMSKLTGSPEASGVSLFP